MSRQQEGSRDAQDHKDATALEDIIDRNGMVDVLATMSSICQAKADHIRQYADSELDAVDWERAADLLAKLTDSHRFKVISP